MLPREARRWRKGGQPRSMAVSSKRKIRRKGGQPRSMDVLLRRKSRMNLCHTIGSTFTRGRQPKTPRRTSRKWRELVKTMELDHGSRVTLKPLWINRILLTRVLWERRGFGRIVKETFQAWREEEQCRMSIMEDIEGIAESLQNTPQQEEHNRNTQKNDEAKGDNEQSEEQNV